MTTYGGTNQGASPNTTGPAQTLGRFVLVREIARSNDIVWEGRDPQMHRRVAVKELQIAQLTGQARRDRIERFHREARAAGSMNHPNIVTIYEVGEDKGRFYIAMEFLEGQTLRDRLTAAGGPLPVGEAIDIAFALADALEYAHGRGVIHRDIKPDNVFIVRGSEAARVKLTDFGIARITHENQLTLAGQVFGTPSYMSPEQVLGREIDARSDLFSLGILLYEMVTGRKPFTGDSVVTITYRIMNEQTPPALGSPPILQNVIARATAKDPRERYASAHEFKAALLAAQSTINGRSGATVPPGVAGSLPQYGPPAPPYPAQPTALYGAQTQFGVGPVQSPSPVLPIAPVYAPPVQQTAPPVIAPYAPPSNNRLTTAIIASVIIGGAALVGGVALKRAFTNYSKQNAGANLTSEYNTGVKQYQNKQYEEAAQTFKRLRTNPTTAPDTLQKAREGELYAYRALGQAAQTGNDLDAAERWFNQALEVAPNDAQARTELEAVRRAKGAPSPIEATPVPVVETSPAPSATPPATLPTATPGPDAPGSVSAAQFQQTNNQLAASAQQLLQQGDQAWRAGNADEARRLWREAQVKGVATSVYNQAGQRLQHDLNNEDPLGQ